MFSVQSPRSLFIPVCVNILIFRTAVLALPNVSASTSAAGSVIIENTVPGRSVAVSNLTSLTLTFLAVVVKNGSREHRSVMATVRSSVVGSVVGVEGREEQAHSVANSVQIKERYEACAVLSSGL
jgi:hypothetical protein